ncbi:MAG: chromosomal replication initiator protein DnaA [Pseudomonadota bacterium]
MAMVGTGGRATGLKGVFEETGRDGAKGADTNEIAAFAGRARAKSSTTQFQTSKSQGPDDAKNADGNAVSADRAAQFDRVIVQLKARVGSEVFSSWFTRMQFDSFDGGVVRLTVPTNFLKNWISSKYSDLLLDLWKSEDDATLRVDIAQRSVVRAAKPGSESAALDAQQTKSAQPAQVHFGAAATNAAQASLVKPQGMGSPLDRRYTFDHFVEGAANRVAYAAARAVAETGSNAVRFNPLYLHAGVGLGKTHLLQAIAWEARRSGQGDKVAYLTAEYFMWQFASAIRDNTTLSFKESLRDIDLLLIDDLQFLQGKSIQHEFCHLLNALIDSAKQVVVAADRPPQELESLDARVRSRLQGGVAVEMGTPDYDLRLLVVHRYRSRLVAEDPSISIPDHVLEQVARKVTSSCRDVEGALNQLVVQYKFSDADQMQPQLIDRILGNLVRHGEQKRVMIEDIQRVVSKHFGVSRQDLLSNRRTRVIVRPRQIAMFLSKNLTPRSLPEIGRHFGGRDHTTVLHAVRKVEELSNSEPKFAQELELLTRLIQE